jgi:hypothetical protein
MTRQKQNLLSTVTAPIAVITMGMINHTSSKSTSKKRRRYSDQRRQIVHYYVVSSVFTNRHWLLLFVCFIFVSNSTANTVKTAIDVVTTDTSNDSDTSDTGVHIKDLSVSTGSGQQDDNPGSDTHTEALEYCDTVDGTEDSTGQACESKYMLDVSEAFSSELRNEDSDENSGVTLGCKLVMAASTIPNSGWGIFSLVDRQPGTPIMDGDVVIQVTDFNESIPDATTLQRFQDYFTSAEETGGYYDASRVMSALPGIGMLANGLPDKQHNVLPYVPTVDEGGLVRTESPGSGAISHYHNYTYYALRPISAGSELFVKYDNDRIARHQTDIVQSSSTKAMDVTRKHDVQWLMRNGDCLDNLKPDKSKQPNSGRGVFAKRFIPINGIVAPIPLLVINHRTYMDIKTVKKDKTIVRTQQLLINYCFGHPQSSLLFFPYSSMVK